MEKNPTNLLIFSLKSLKMKLLGFISGNIVWDQKRQID